VIGVIPVKPFIMDIHQDVRNGTLTRANLDRYIEADRTDLEKKDPIEGLTPLGAATVAGYADEVQLLLTSGAKADTLSKDGETPLLLAASKADKNRARIIQLLLETTPSSAIDATSPSANNNTPLMCVVQKKDAESIRLLRKARASLTLTNDDGYDAKDLAYKTYDRVVIRALNPDKEKGDFDMLIDMVVGLLLFIVAWLNKAADQIIRWTYGLNVDLDNAWDQVSANFHLKYCSLTRNHRL
jgi:ankyrin repeat protein